MSEEISGFGQGTAYCLTLFLMHKERLQQDLLLYAKMREKSPTLFSENHARSIWFNGAGDHLYDLQINPKWHERLKERLKIFQEKVISWRCCFHTRDAPSQEDFDWSIREALDLIMELDKLSGINVVKGEYE